MQFYVVRHQKIVQYYNFKVTFFSKINLYDHTNIETFMPFNMRIIMFQDLELVGSVVYLGSLIVKQHAAVLSLWHVV